MKNKTKWVVGILLIMGLVLSLSGCGESLTDIQKKEDAIMARAESGKPTDKLFLDALSKKYGPQYKFSIVSRSTTSSLLEVTVYEAIMREAGHPNSTFEMYKNDDSAELRDSFSYVLIQDNFEKETKEIAENVFHQKVTVTSVLLADFIKPRSKYIQGTTAEDFLKENAEKDGFLMSVAIGLSNPKAINKDALENKLKEVSAALRAKHMDGLGGNYLFLLNCKADETFWRDSRDAGNHRYPRHTKEKAILGSLFWSSDLDGKVGTDFTKGGW